MYVHNQFTSHMKRTLRSRGLPQFISSNLIEMYVWADQGLNHFIAIEAAVYGLTTCVCVFLVPVRLSYRTEVLHNPSSIQLGSELMTSIARSWQCISCHWDACSDHSVISGLLKRRNLLPHYLNDLRWFQMYGLSYGLMRWQLIFLVQVWIRTEVLCNPSSTQQGFELMTSRSWQYLSCHRDACCNHSAISDLLYVDGQNVNNSITIEAALYGHITCMCRQTRVLIISPQ